MNITKRHIILKSESAKDALRKFNDLQQKEYFILFVTDRDNKLVGTLSDGDIRRGLLSGKSIEEEVTNFIRKDFKCVNDGYISPFELKLLREQQFILIPCIDKHGYLTGVLDLNKQKNKLPLDAVLMAGGKGRRLLPLTEKIPKPLLKIGERPIIEWNIKNLLKYGVQNIYVCLNHLKEPLIAYLSKQDYASHLTFIEEESELGTFGALSLITNFSNESILVMNSDLLTNIDFEDFFIEHTNKKAHLSIASTGYSINIPYAVLRNEGGEVISLEEKPTENYLCNAGIYLFNKKLISQIPKQTFFNATDFIDKCIVNKHKVVTYSMLCYWLDIGKPDDYRRAQEDIKHLKF